MSILSVKELQAMLADCDPNAPFEIAIPAFIADPDSQIIEDGDQARGGQLVHIPKITTGFAGMDVIDGSGRVKHGAQPNRVVAELTDQDLRKCLEARRLAIESAAAERAAAGNHVIVDVRLPRELHDRLRDMLRTINASTGVKNDETTHGALTLAGLLVMLAEDVSMATTRPGSWEGANMYQVLSGHGYHAPAL